MKILIVDDNGNEQEWVNRRKPKGKKVIKEGGKKSK